MVQMTYQGIRMLASLDPQKFFVLPFQDSVPELCSVMEVYPRETLYSLSLPDVRIQSRGEKGSSYSQRNSCWTSKHTLTGKSQRLSAHDDH